MSLADLLPEAEAEAEAEEEVVGEVMGQQALGRSRAAAGSRAVQNSWVVLTNNSQDLSLHISRAAIS